MYTNQSDHLMDVTVRLEQGIQAIRNSETYRSYLNLMSRFHHYSASNCLLILMQKPDATYVAGYRKWQNTFSRNVRKGKKAIRIIAPVRKKDDSSTDVSLSAFRTASVFDISQTEGKPLPYSELKTISQNVEQYDTFFRRLCLISPVPIVVEDTGSHAHGYYDPRNKRIVIAPDLPEAHCLKTAVHEIAHAILHADEAETREQMELEAESAAYVVMQHFGIDTSEYSFPYVTLWSSSMHRNQIRSSLEKIRLCAERIITDLNRTEEA